MDASGRWRASAVSRESASVALRAEVDGETQATNTFIVSHKPTLCQRRQMSILAPSLPQGVVTATSQAGQTAGYFLELIEPCEPGITDQQLGVLVVEGRPLLRAAISALLDLDPQVRLLGESDTQEAAAAIELLKPDLVVVGVDGPQDLHITQRAVQGRPRMLAFVWRSDAQLVTQTVQAGFAGVVLNSSATCELRQALQAVKSGKVYLGAKASALLKDCPEDLGVPVENLSNREREVLGLLAEGHSTKQIAGMLMLSSKTIETHRLRIMRKLKLFSIAELTKYAIRNGLTRI
jgi:DNA-binding NarL/FixJ family response regulator